jgi:hypothetical protein
VAIELDTFAEWLERIKSGDQEAAAELVRLIEPRLLRAIRVRLGHFRLTGVIDPRDISQTVLGAFFRRASVAPLEIHSLEHLKALLATMARNKTHDEARWYLAHRRDRRLVRALPHEQLSLLMSSEPTPSKVVASHELIEELWRRFTVEERHLLELRVAGREWNTISQENGGQPEQLRKKLNRAIHRVLRELQIEV